MWIFSSPCIVCAANVFKYIISSSIKQESECTSGMPCAHNCAPNEFFQLNNHIQFSHPFFQFPFQNDTMRIVYMYHEADPLHGSIVPGSLPSPQQAFKGYKPLSITQRQQSNDDNPSITVKSLLASSVWSPAVPTAPAAITSSASPASSASSAAGSKVHISELRNDDVKLPPMDTLFSCKVFEFQEFSQKHHLVKVSKTHTQAKPTPRLPLYRMQLLHMVSIAPASQRLCVRVNGCDRVAALGGKRRRRKVFLLPRPPLFAIAHISVDRLFLGAGVARPAFRTYTNT